MKLNDAVFGVLFLALGALVLFAIRGYPNIPGQPVGPALFPGLIAVGLCITGALLVLRGLRDRPHTAWLEWEDWIHSPRHVMALTVLLGSVVFYILAAEQLGFLPTASLLLLALFTVLKVSLGRALFFAVVASLLVHFAFYKLLRVPLPWGLLTPWAW
ncbi:MAG: tripartite tricarboxylate transporter TctB family protein [Betaproteobacteria bacterium]|jgi:putative tricarboxylic transport membrane protein|nr:tripartite tricarboxylate transporter TctB family protein [Burkholderiales bacterium]NBX15342.1 tripartite tricarboxylate transporter TctB family protein [Betaproteobacteria bacterium]